ncbi:MAG: MarR family transcriptional regulator, partial [Burkholderiales bacterium]|nr:MarR family transcriptional regulator [Burkholderiales bacterium]
MKAPAPDSETRARAEDHLALRLWLRMLACTNLVEAPLRSRLREQFDGSLPRFDLMAQLER